MAVCATCALCRHRCSPPRATFAGPEKCKAERKISFFFFFLLIMLWDTRVMKTHSYTDIAPDLMFWCLNLPALHFFYEVTNNGLNILSSEKSGTDAHSPGWKCIWVDLKINSMQCQFWYIFHKSHAGQERLQLNWRVSKQVRSAISVKRNHWTHDLSLSYNYSDCSPISTTVFYISASTVCVCFL